MDKVQKIREEVERIQLYSQSETLKQILDYIDKVQKESISEPNKELAETYLAVFNKKFPILPSLSGKQLADYKNFLNKCQLIFGLKEWGIRPIQSKLFEKLTLLWAAWGAEHLQGVGRQDENEQDIPVREDFEKTFISMVNATHENNGSYSLHDFAQRLYNIAKEELEEPVSEELEEAMQHNAPDNIGIDDLLYWRNGFITGANWQKQQDLIPSTELSNFIDKLSKQFPEVSFAKLSRIAVRVAKWQKQQEYTCYEEAFEDGAKWKAEQFEKNRLKHCNSITNEQAELEQGFIDQHIDKYQRMPTFLDVIEYGMRLQKEKMMANAIDAVVHIEAGNYPYIPQIELYDYNKDEPLAKEGDKYKVILIKED